MANIFHLLGELALAALAMDILDTEDEDVEPEPDESLDAGIPTG